VSGNSAPVLNGDTARRNQRVPVVHGKRRARGGVIRVLVGDRPALMRPEIDRDITRVFQSNNQPRIVVNRAPECRVHFGIGS
jgi:hypothetical protein